MSKRLDKRSDKLVKQIIDKNKIIELIDTVDEIIESYVRGRLLELNDIDADNVDELYTLACKEMKTQFLLKIAK